MGSAAGDRERRLRALGERRQVERRKGYVLIVGGGSIGYFLARSLTREGYRASVLDRDRERARRIADELGITTYAGDGTDLECLRASGAGDAAHVIAMTSDDGVNLVVCQLAKREFGTGTTIALISDPKNEELFERLGVDETVCASSMVVRMVENLLPARGMRLLSEIGRSAAEINEFALDDRSPSIGLPVSALRLPSECLLVAIARDDDVIVPRGDTALLAGDRVYGLSRTDAAPVLRSVLLGA